jgi:hypothetical protein
MAVEEQIFDLGFCKAAADLSDYQYHWNQLSDAFTVNVAGAADANLLGIQQDIPAAAGRPVSVRRVGVSKLVLGGVVAYGNRITSDANGHGVVATTGERYGAIAIEAGTATMKVSVLMEFGVAP